MNMHRQVAQLKWASGLMFLILLFAACTAPVIPETPQQRLGAAYAMYAGMVNVAASQVEAGKLTKSEAINVQEQLLKVRNALDSSANLILTGAPGNEAEAIQILQSATLILNQIAAELAAKEAP